MFFEKILSTFWVPGANLRGKQVASKELDGSLDTTAKVMSVSTIWDFACTLPIFTYAVGGIAKGLAGPTGFLLGFIILWASNLTGENSTNKTRGNKGKARVSLIAFLILSLAKTAVSGVGIEMLISKDSIIENDAFETLKISFKELVPTFRGRLLDMPHFQKGVLEEIGFLISNKVEEDFKLVIDYIKTSS